LAVGVLVVVMTISFEPLVHWLAVTAAVTSIGWSLLMALALHSRLDREELAKLATGSHWFDIVLALTVFAIFLPDPVATPVAALPLLVFRLATRHGRPGAWGGGAVFVGLIVVRIVVSRMLNGEGLVRPPLLLAWALVVTLVVVLALEIRSHALAEEAAEREEELRSPEHGRRHPGQPRRLPVAAARAGARGSDADAPRAGDPPPDGSRSLLQVCGGLALHLRGNGAQPRPQHPPQARHQRA